MIFYTIHMICDAHPVMFDLFLVLQAPSKVRSTMQNADVLMYDPQHKPIQPSAISKKRNTGSLTVAKAVYEASAPGVTLFEDFIRSREANKTHDEAQHVSKTRHRLVRRRLYKKPIGPHTDESSHYKSGEFLVLPRLRSASAVERSGAFSRVSEPQRTVVNVGGGHKN